MSKKLNLKNLKTIITKETNKLCEEYTEEKIAADIKEKFLQAYHNTFCRIMGFEIGSWNSWTIDHCNGRMSLITDFLTNKAKKIIIDEMEKVVKKIKFTEEMRKEIEKEFMYQLSCEIKQISRGKAKEMARKIVDKEFDVFGE